MSRPLPTAAFVAVVLVAMPSAQAFASVQRGDSPHDDITAVAHQLGWPEDAVEALQEGVVQADIADFDEEQVDGGKRLVVTPVFSPAHHCDRVPPDSDADAFNATLAYIAWERRVAENLSLLDPWGAMRALGRALHALQDCFSHSNVVDLDPLAQGQLAHALVHGGSMPAGLVLCGSQPGIPEIGRPPGDPYAHDDRNKDAPHSTPESEALLADGRTKHEAARDLAQEATAAFLRDFTAGLDGAASARLMAIDDDEIELDDSDEDGEGPFGVPAVGVVLLPALAVAVALRRRGC